MKTIEELYREVIASEDLKKEFLALKPEEVEGFAEKYGCKATLDEIKSFLTEKSAAGELSDEEINQVAGGKSADLVEGIVSVCSLGLGCAAIVLGSAMKGNVGTAVKGKGMLCET